MVRSPDGDKDFFDIVSTVLQRYTLAPYLFIICQEYALGKSIDLIKNGFTPKMARRKRYHAETITDAEYVDDIVLLENTPAPAESLLHCLVKTAGGRGLYVNANKTVYEF